MRTCVCVRTCVYVYVQIWAYVLVRLYENESQRPLSPYTACISVQPTQQRHTQHTWSHPHAGQGSLHTLNDLFCLRLRQDLGLVALSLLSVLKERCACVFQSLLNLTQLCLYLVSRHPHLWAVRAKSLIADISLSSEETLHPRTPTYDSACAP